MYVINKMILQFVVIYLIYETFYSPSRLDFPATQHESMFVQKQDRPH